MKVVNLGNVFLMPEDIKRIQAKAEFVAFDTDPQSDPEILSRIGDAEIVIKFLTPFKASLIEQLERVQLVTIAATGFDSIDLKAAQKHGITVCYTPDYSTESVAEYTIGLMLACARHICVSNCVIHKHNMSLSPSEGLELKGKTLGIVGPGRIGSAVIKIARDGLGMKILTFDINDPRESFEKLLRESDVISLHVPLTKQTDKLFGEAEFSKMKDQVIFLNTARGSVVDEKALLRYLDKGKFFGVGLDVVEHEPISKNHPFLNYPNVLVTPHAAYLTEASRMTRSRLVTDNIIHFIEGERTSLTCVSP